MTTDDELRNLIALAGKATARPWYALLLGRVVEISTAPKNAKVENRGRAIVGWTGFDSSDFFVSKQKHNAAFIAASANLAADMAAELLAARDELQRRRNFMEMYNPNSTVCRECGAYIQEGYNCGECGHDPTLDDEEGGDMQNSIDAIEERGDMIGGAA